MRNLLHANNLVKYFHFALFSQIWFFLSDFEKLHVSFIYWTKEVHHQQMVIRCLCLVNKDFFFVIYLFK